MDYSQYERLHIASVNLKIKLVTEIKKSPRENTHNLILEKALFRKQVFLRTAGKASHLEQSFH